MAHGQIAKDKTTMSLVIPKDLKEELFQIASKENRSASNLIVSLVQNYVNINKQQERLLAYHRLLSDSDIYKDDTK